MEENQIIQQLIQQQQSMEEQLGIDVLMTSVFADFMQRHVSSKYFMLSMEYADQLMRFS